MADIKHTILYKLKIKYLNQLFYKLQVNVS